MIINSTASARCNRITGSLPRGPGTNDSDHLSIATNSSKVLNYFQVISCEIGIRMPLKEKHANRWFAPESSKMQCGTPICRLCIDICAMVQQRLTNINVPTSSCDM